MSLYKTFKLPELILNNKIHGDAKRIALTTQVSYSIIAKALVDGRARIDAFKAICDYYKFV